MIFPRCKGQLHIYNWNIIPGQALIPGPLPGGPDVPGACQTVCDCGVTLQGAMQSTKFRVHPPWLFSLLTVSADPTMQRSSTPGLLWVIQVTGRFCSVSRSTKRGLTAREQSNWCPICSQLLIKLIPLQCAADKEPFHILEQQGEIWFAVFIKQLTTKKKKKKRILNISGACFNCR